MSTRLFYWAAAAVVVGLVGFVMGASPHNHDRPLVYWHDETRGCIIVKGAKGVNGGGDGGDAVICGRGGYAAGGAGGGSK